LPNECRSHYYNGGFNGALMLGGMLRWRHHCADEPECRQTRERERGSDEKRGKQRWVASETMVLILERPRTKSPPKNRKVRARTPATLAAAGVS
jgi:hypothetical protein